MVKLFWWFFNGHFPRWTWVNQYQNVSILDFIGARDDGGGGDNWSCKTCKAAVKTSPPTNQHPVFTGWKPFLLPNQQCLSTEGNCAVLIAMSTTSNCQRVSVGSWMFYLKNADKQRWKMPYLNRSVCVHRLVIIVLVENSGRTADLASHQTCILQANLICYRHLFLFENVNFDFNPRAWEHPWLIGWMFCRATAVLCLSLTVASASRQCHQEV